MGLPLSEIFNRLIKIRNLNFDGNKQDILNKIDSFNNYLKNVKFIESNELKSIEEKLVKELNNYSELIKKIELKLEKAVLDNEASYIKASKKMYVENLEKMLFEEHLEWSQLWPPTDLEFDHFLNQIKQYINWQEPSLIFGANNSKILKATIGTEPIYILERYPEYFNLQKEKFNVSFSRKLRFYDINSINLLPKNSIGLLICFNELNFLPWDISSYLLTTFSQILSPGGKLIFNYNNCKTLRGFVEFENQSMVFSTPEMYIKHLKKYNLNCIHEYTSNRETFSFMIFEKSGVKNLVKKSPSVGYIKQQLTLSKPVEHKARIEHIEKLINNKLT
jgi:hypothetical protein